jgi:cyanate permease
MAAAPKIDPAEEDLDAESFTLKQACRTFAYYILGASNIVWAMAGTGVLFYLFTLCEERGLPDGTAASVFKILGVTMLTAQLGGGILGDFLPLGRLYGLGTSMVAASLLWLTFDVSVVGTRAFAALFGAGQGMLVAISGIAWVRYYGRKHLGAIRGAVWCGTVAGSGCGPFIMGTVKDLTGNYDAAVLLFGCLMTPLAVAGWFIRPPRT